MASQCYQEIPAQLFDKEYQLEVCFWYTPADPGKLTGPPENCYPPEPEEIELESVRFSGEGEILSRLPDELIREIETYLLENRPEYDPGDDY